MNATVCERCGDAEIAEDVERANFMEALRVVEEQKSEIARLRAEVDRVSGERDDAVARWKAAETQLDEGIYCDDPQCTRFGDDIRWHAPSKSYRCMECASHADRTKAGAG